MNNSEIGELYFYFALSPLVRETLVEESRVRVNLNIRLFSCPAVIINT